LIEPALARHRPIVEVIISRRGVHLVLRGLVLSRDYGLLPVVNRERSAIRGNLASAIPHGYVCLVAIGIRIDSIVAGRADIKSAIRRVHLDIPVHGAYANRQRPFRKLYLCVAVIQIQKLKRGT
jgi:hypothetical protein